MTRKTTTESEPVQELPVKADTVLGSGSLAAVQHFLKRDALQHSPDLSGLVPETTLPAAEPGVAVMPQVVDPGSEATRTEVCKAVVRANIDASKLGIEVEPGELKDAIEATGVTMDQYGEMSRDRSFRELLKDVSLGIIFGTRLPAMLLSATEAVIESGDSNSLARLMSLQTEATDAEQELLEDLQRSGEAGVKETLLRLRGRLESFERGLSITPATGKQMAASRGLAESRDSTNVEHSVIDHASFYGEDEEEEPG